ncbi:MAG: NAD(+)/NADH kinase [Clostridia bacterium]|nr:NAD(+)/NADH kinase [Clostridia bacterium]
MQKKEVHKSTIKAIKHLNRLDIKIVMESGMKKYFEMPDIIFFDGLKQTIKACDIVLVVGGDGSIIHAAKHAALENKPVLGLNMGRVGFVAELEINELDRLADLTTGNYSIEKRMMLDIVVSQKNSKRKFLALNDAVISRGALSRMIELAVSYNGSKMSHYRSDGLIISTPTGSTAYSLSAGGPVIEPQMKAMLLTPICAQSLFSRSVVFSDKAKLKISSEEYDVRDEISLSIDGETAIKLDEDFCITIGVSDTSVKLVKLKDVNFYSLLNDKLSEKRT